MKANSNLSVLSILAKLGSGFDIVSGGELARVKKAGGDTSRIVFSGVGKQEEEIATALEAGIFAFNVESIAEIELIEYVAKYQGMKAPISVRTNPDVDPKTHPYISTGLAANKFGIPDNEVMDIYERLASSAHLEIKGIDCHIGSQIIDTEPLLQALDQLIKRIDLLKASGIKLSHIDIGGGLGVPYKNQSTPDTRKYLHDVKKRLGKRKLKLVLEPGRSIAASAGIFLTKIILKKSNGTHNFIVVDGAMNDFVRPSLYGAWQEIIEVEKKITGTKKLVDVVGPICETGDFLGKNRLINAEANDLLAIKHAGAYGFIMASNYNTRARCAEVMVDGHKHYLVRAREKLEALWEHEFIIPQ